MARYFFHLKSTVPLEDMEGIELSDVAAAREKALQFAREHLGHHANNADVIVTDENGVEVFTVTLPPDQPDDHVAGARTEPE